ncbi:MAG: replication protein, partial [Lactobacillus crispatus]|nr:replication protein [Lactobacillus crispatus]
MAETHLKDMIIPTVFGNWVQNLSEKTNNFIKSGIMTADSDLGGRLNQPGTKITIPYINDLDGTPNNWTDDTDIP